MNQGFPRSCNKEGGVDGEFNQICDNCAGLTLDNNKVKEQLKEWAESEAQIEDQINEAVNTRKDLEKVEQIPPEVRTQKPPKRFADFVIHGNR